MQSVFRLLSLIIAISIIFSATMVYAYKTPYEEECTLGLYNLGIVKGYEDGTFRCENKISRTEFVTLIVRIMGLENIQITSDCPFTDVPKDYWGYNYINISTYYKFINGYGDNTFRPNETITFAEAISIIIRILGYNKDVVGSWPTNYMDKAKEIKLTEHIYMPPNNDITRGDSFVLISDALMIEYIK